MDTTTLNKPHLLTKLLIWDAKWSAQYASYGEPVVLLHARKVNFGTGVILIEFTKSPTLRGQRFCIRKQEAQACALSTNGKAQMYIIPLSHLSVWQSASEVRDIALSIWKDTYYV